MTDLRNDISERAAALGFSFAGFAAADPPEHLRAYYEKYLDEGRDAGFTYIRNGLEKRLNPSLIMEDVQSVVTFLAGYGFPGEYPGEEDLVVSRYAMGRDYHAVLRSRLKAMAGFVTGLAPGTMARSFVDSGPVAEKFWATRCGAGWQGKNSLVISPGAGSFHFICILFTNLTLEPSAPARDLCGHCTTCADACPTGALSTPYQLDIRRCISYYTIEKKEPMPSWIKPLLKGRIYGCDICQDACPYNRKMCGGMEEFRPSAEILSMKRKDWVSLTPERFGALFSGTSVERAGYDQLMRNIRACTDPPGDQLPPQR